MMDRAVQEFTDRLTESTDRDSLQQSMTIITAELNLACFAYVALPDILGGCPRLISTYPSSWTARYLERRYEHFDPVVSQAMRRNRPFRWGLGFGPQLRSEKERELFEEAAMLAFDVASRFQYMTAVARPRAVTFASDKRQLDFERLTKKHTPILRLMSMYFHAHAKARPIERWAEYCCLLREFEFLEWAALGKSAADIGRAIAKFWLRPGRSGGGGYG